MVGSGEKVDSYGKEKWLVIKKNTNLTPTRVCDGLCM